MTEQRIASDTDSCFAAADFYPRSFASYSFLPRAAPFTPRRPPMTITGLDKWHAYLKSHDRAALWDLLHPDAVFESPVVHTPQRGREITFKYLATAGKVLGEPSFRYVGERRSAGVRERDRRDQDQRRRHHHLQRLCGQNGTDYRSAEVGSETQTMIHPLY